MTDILDRRRAAHVARTSPASRIATGLAIACTLFIFAPAPAQADDALDGLRALLPSGITLSSLLPFGPELVSGTVETDGEPEGAAVTLYAWPSNDTIESMQVGDIANVQPIAAAIAGANGVFDLRVPNLTALVPYSDSAGIVNLEVVAQDLNGGESRWSFSRQLDGISFDSDGTVLTLPTGLRDPISSLLGTPAAATLDMLAGAASPEDLNSDVAAPDSGCVWTFSQKLSPSQVTIGGTFSSVSGVSDTMKYTNGAVSTLGVGLEVNGPGTSWSASGTQSRSTSSTVTFPTHSGSASYWHKTFWQYAKWSSNCGPNADHFGNGGEVEVRPYAFAAGAVESSTSARTLTHCSYFTAGSGFTLNSTSAVTWTNGVAISNVIGINLSSHSGYSSTVETTYSFSASHHLCGYVNLPGNGPGYLSAQS